MKQLAHQLIAGFILSLLLCPTTQAQSPIGKWKSFDDKTGEVRSVVELYQQDGKIFGKIAEIFDDTEEDPKCTACPKKDDRYMQSILGMEIIRNLEAKGNEWKNGTVLDPESGGIYDCKIWLEDENTLKLRGYLLFVYRTQTWKRVNEH